ASPRAVAPVRAGGPASCAPSEGRARWPACRAGTRWRAPLRPRSTVAAPGASWGCQVWGPCRRGSGHGASHRQRSTRYDLDRYTACTPAPHGGLPPGMSESNPDPALIRQLEQRLAEAGLQVDVERSDGALILSGFVSSEEARQAAEDIVAQTAPNATID